MAERIVVVAPTPPGVEGVEWRKTPACTHGEVLLLHPQSPPPRGPCRWARVPHRSLLPRVVELVAGGADPGDAVLQAALDAVREALDYEPAWSARGLSPPRRPPPIQVWGNVYHDTGGPREAARLEAEGADAIVYGGRPGGCDGYLEGLKQAVEEAGVPVLADPGGCAGPVEVYEAGAAGYMSITLETAGRVPEWLRSMMAFIVIPDGTPRDPSARAAMLVEAEETLLSMGYSRIVLDPVAQPLVSPGLLPSLAAAMEASKTVESPIMLGLENAYELLDADTHAAIAVLVALAAEAGVSIVLVGEHSWKSRGAVLEAKTAAALVGAALKLGTPPKDYPVRLLPWKGKGRDYP